jgi:hypothetical protein
MTTTTAIAPADVSAQPRPATYVQREGAAALLAESPFGE